MNTLILLVNDIPDHLEVYQRALLGAGYRVTVADTGADALERAAAEPPDCAVIDVRLPDMRGWDLCRELKTGPAHNVPVVLLADQVSHGYAHDSASVGCNAWIAYPTVGDDLVRVVRQVLATGDPVPESPEAALLGVRTCPACASDRLRPTLRMGLIQNFCCRQCGFCWRVDTEPA